MLGGRWHGIDRLQVGRLVVCAAHVNRLRRFRLVAFRTGFVHVQTLIAFMVIGGRYLPCHYFCTSFHSHVKHCFNNIFFQIYLRELFWKMSHSGL